MDALDLILTAVIAFVVTLVAGKFLIPFLHRIKFGQPIIEEYGPTWHAKKRGTPTMGGFIFLLGVFAAVITGFIIYGVKMNQIAPSPQVKQQTIRLVIHLLMVLFYLFIGFIDDFIKVVRKHNAGLQDLHKFLMQVAVSALYLAAMTLFGGLDTIIHLPIFGAVDFGWLYYPICLVLIVGVTNAVNITDGVDGLCASVTFFAAVGFFMAASILGQRDICLMAVALAGGMIAYLIYNFHPAKVMMGDTGSMMLGAMLVAMAFGLDQPFLLLPFASLYIIEMLTVVIQTIYYKLTHKRLFKMTPIHHSFELSGYSEAKICLLFSAVEAVGCLLGVWFVTTL